jgi:hypothetical protein
MIITRQELYSLCALCTGRSPGTGHGLLRRLHGYRRPEGGPSRLSARGCFQGELFLPGVTGDTFHLNTAVAEVSSF